MSDFTFTRKISLQTKIMFICVILPIYVYCGSLIVSALLKFLMIHFSWPVDYAAANVYLNLIMDLGLLIIVGLILKDDISQQIKDYPKQLSSNLFQGLLVGPLSIYALSILGGLITLLLGGTSSSQNQALINVLIQSKPFVMIITTVIIAPILEELVFRGIVFSWLYEYNRFFAHIATAFVFAFVHIMIALFSGNMSEWIQIFSYFFMALPLSYLYEKTNNIFVPISTHMTSNLLSVIVLFFV